MPRLRTFPCAALAILLVGGCVSRSRPHPGATTPEALAPARLTDTFEAFAMARAGDELHVLALSGGGQNGAFGAGVLAGWRSAGRPRFDVVAGISTGALEATHAFLGTPADDEVLRVVYTQTRKSQILCPRSPLAIPFGASAFDFQPLRRFIEDVFDDATIDRVGAASEGGRRLLVVGTTNLDSGRMTVWDLGATARARAYSRYREVLFASSCPPLLAEPVFLDGAMHADGSVAAHVFVPNPDEHLDAAKLAAYRAVAERRSPGLGTRVAIDVISNAVLRNAPKRVENAAIPIGKRTVELVLSNAAKGSLWVLHGAAARRKYAFRLTSIPETLQAEADDPFAFDGESMRVLYAAGVEAGRHASSWASEPPPLDEE